MKNILISSLMLAALALASCERDSVEPQIAQGPNPIVKSNINHGNNGNHGNGNNGNHNGNANNNSTDSICAVQPDMVFPPLNPEIQYPQVIYSSGSSLAYDTTLSQVTILVSGVYSVTASCYYYSIPGSIQLLKNNTLLYDSGIQTSPVVLSGTFTLNASDVLCIKSSDLCGLLPGGIFAVTKN